MSFNYKIEEYHWRIIMLRTFVLRSTGWVILAIALIIVANGCGKKSPTSPPNNNGNSTARSISISGFYFIPSATNISVGDTVTWRNNDSVPHTVTSDAGSELHSPSLSLGQTYRHVFSAAGTFSYHCSVHPGMRGSVVVR